MGSIAQILREKMAESEPIADRKLNLCLSLIFFWSKKGQARSRTTNPNKLMVNMVTACKVPKYQKKSI